MRVAILHNEVGAGAAADEADVLVQVETVAAALAGRGHRIAVVPCGLDLAGLAARLDADRPDVVFNLVEGLGGHARLIAVVPFLLESLGIPHAGCPADAIHLTGHKTVAKRLLAQALLPTPAWRDEAGGGEGDGAERWIVKSVWEDASVGIDDDAVTSGGIDRAHELLASRRGRAGGPWFAEAFVDGREFNLAVLDGSRGPQVLPPAEIVFRDYPPGKPRIVGYAAKWDESSFEYGHTERVFADPAGEGALLEELERLALDCWRLFDLRGWARVDFRVDAVGKPYILEVNANPCLSPDAGFAAAVARAGMPFAEAAARILAAAG